MRIVGAPCSSSKAVRQAAIMSRRRTANPRIGAVLGHIGVLEQDVTHFPVQQVDDEVRARVLRILPGLFVR